MSQPTSPDPNVKMSTRLWSTEVAIVEAAEGEDLQKRETAYEFSNGRRFVREADPYESTEPPPP